MRYSPKSTDKTALRSCAGESSAYILSSILVFGLLARLFFLQVIHGERYTFLSENNRVRIKSVPGTRGMVFDRQGQLLVDSRPSFDLLFVPEEAGAGKTLRQLRSYLTTGREGIA